MTASGWLITIFLGAVAFIIGRKIFLGLRQEKANHQMGELEAIEENQRFASVVRQFEEETIGPWPNRFVIKLQRAQRYLLINEDRSRIRYVQLTRSPVNPVAVDHEFAVSDIVSAAIQQQSEVITGFETRTEIRKQSGLGRAAVGGLLFGGVGAIVGAVSAGSNTVTTTAATNHTRYGLVYIVINTSDLMSPRIKIPVLSRTSGEEWLHCIRSCMAHQANKQS